MIEDEGKSKESIWSINPDWRVWFYGVLSIWGIVVSFFTLYEEWSKSGLEIFDVLEPCSWFGRRCLVCVQVGETAMGAYQYLVELGKARRLEAEARLQKAEEKGRKEAQDRVRKWIEEGLRKQGIPEEQIQQVLKLIDALEKDR